MKAIGQRRAVNEQNRAGAIGSTSGEHGPLGGLAAQVIGAGIIAGAVRLAFWDAVAIG